MLRYDPDVSNTNRIKVAETQITQNKITVYSTRSQYHDTFKESVLQWIVMCLIPFSMVNNDHFRNMINCTNTKAPVMGRHGLVGKIKEKVEIFIGGIKVMLALIFIALTTDGWTSVQNISYIALTAHS